MSSEWIHNRRNDDARMGALVRALLLPQADFEQRLASLDFGDKECSPKVGVLEPWLPERISEAVENPWSLTNDEIETILGFEEGLRFLYAWIHEAKDISPEWEEALIRYAS